MNVAQLTQGLAKKHGLTARQARAILDSVVEDVVAAVAAGEVVALPGLGKFGSKATAAREGRNPRTGAPMKIAASKKVTFSAAQAFKAKL